MTYRRLERFAYHIPNRRDGFPNPNGEVIFFYFNHGKKGGYPGPNEYMMKVEIPSFSENIDIESFLNWVYEVGKSLTWLMFPRRSKSSLWRTSSSKEEPHSGTNYKS